MKSGFDFQGCVDVFIIFALLFVLLIVIAYLLYRRLTDGVHFGKDAPPGEIDPEDMLAVPLDDGDICPACGIGILVVEKTESKPEEVTIGTYHLKCSHCSEIFPDG